MGVFKFAMNKGKEIIADRNKVAEKAIRKEVEDLGLDDELGNDFKVSVEGKQVKLEGRVPDLETMPTLPFLKTKPGMMPTLASSGVMTPGQLGPINVQSIPLI